MNIVITGAGKGMGKALAEKFAIPGNEIFICARNENELARTAREIGKAKKTRISWLATDLGEKTGADNFVKWLSAEKRITPDILINNAGQFIPGSVYNEPGGTLEKMISVNLYSAYYVTR